MDTEELQHYLESRRKDLSGKEFLALIFEMLEKDPPEEMRDILRVWLVACSHVDKDRVAQYWESYLSDPDPFQRESAALQLATLARGPDSLAYKILADYLGEAPAEDQEIDIIIKRLRNLFPGQDDEEDQS